MNTPVLCSLGNYEVKWANISPYLLCNYSQSLGISYIKIVPNNVCDDIFSLIIAYTIRLFV